MYSYVTGTRPYMLTTLWVVSCTAELTRYCGIPRHVPIGEAEEEIYLDHEDIEFKHGHTIH